MLHKHPFDTLCDCLKQGNTSLTLESVNSNKVDWRAVCSYSRTQGCDSLLYQQLKDKGVLTQLPSEYQSHLKQSFFGDSARALRYIHFLKSFLAELNKKGIKTLLLKGSATFVDHLYENNGLRPMGDLDILIPDEQIVEAQKILLAQGFAELYQNLLDGSVIDKRHHHLPTLHHPQLDILVELHFEVAYGQIGRILTAQHGWHTQQEICWDGIDTAILSPTERVLHNIIHALKKDYIAASINFRQLVEFSYLVNRYRDDINWPQIISLCQQEGYTTPLFSYCLLANQLLNAQAPEIMLGGYLARFHAWRLYTGLKLSTSYKPVLSSCEKLKKALLLGYYRLALTSWAWENVCYAPGWRNLPIRIRCMTGRLRQGLKALLDPTYDPVNERKP